MILLIDNYDSFTYNLFQLISGIDKDVRVVKNDQITIDEIKKLAPSHIVISPGPGRPEESGMSREVIQTFYQTTPILGVCLGHQCIGSVFGSHIVQAPIIMHGKTDEIYHDESRLFTGIVYPLRVARYHSLVIEDVPSGFKKTAWSNDGSIMAIEHEAYPVFGVQFHPESFMSADGERLMRNFLV